MAKGQEVIPMRNSGRIVARYLNYILNGIMALLELIILGYIFCTLLAPAFLATSWGSQMWDTVRNFWVTNIYSAALADPEVLINNVIINVVGLVKSLIKPEFLENFTVGLSLWLVLEGIGFALGLRRFRYIRFFRAEDFRPVFDEPMRTTRTRRAPGGGRHAEVNDSYDRVIHQEDNNQVIGRHLRND